LTRHRSINRRYATLARELGLDVAYRDPIGWSATSVPDPATARYAETLTELTEALVLWRRAEQASPVGPRRSRNALACSCDCGRRIRVARSVLELAPILCAGCAQPFEPEDDAARRRARVNAAGHLPNRMELGSCRGLGAGMEAASGCRCR
jgi:hypothetical protein